MFKKISYLFIAFHLVFFVNGCSRLQDSAPPLEKTQPQSKASNTHTHVIPQQSRGRPTKAARRPTHSRQSVRINPRQIVAAHNKVRSRHKLPPLSWSPSLAKFSTQWANHLLQTKGCHMQHRPHSGRFKTDFGENLFWASPYRWTDGRSEIQNISSANVVHEWAKEVKFYDYQRNRCQRGQQCGHYTQMVWRNSRKVGCGLAVCADKSQVWVCSYNPPGNWQGERPY